MRAVVYYNKEIMGVMGMLSLRKRDWTSLAVQCLIVMLGIYFIWQRQQALVHITTLMAIGIVLTGLWGVLLCFIDQRRTEVMAMVPPIITIVFGVALLVFRSAVTGIIPFFVGLWALMMGVVKVIIAVQYATSQEPGWWLQIPQAALRLGLGVLILSGALNLNAIFTVIMGVYLIFYGVFNIVEYITVIVLKKKRG